MTQTWKTTKKKKARVIVKDEINEMNSWLKRTRWHRYLIELNREQLSQSIARLEKSDEFIAKLLWSTMKSMTRHCQQTITFLLRSKLHKKYSHLIDFNKRDQWHEQNRVVEIVKVAQLDKSISSTKSILLTILCRSLLTIDSFSSSTINTIIEQTSLVFFWLIT